MLKKPLSSVIFVSRWLLYPINIGLLVLLTAYVGTFIYDAFHFLRHEFQPNMESLMVLLLGFVDASMVANLVIMIVQGSHQIFLQKFNIDRSEIPQYLDHIDSGILKVKVALSITSITLVQLLKDFVNIEHVDWTMEMHRITLHAVTLLSALMTALIWRVTHPQK